jgi:hypothetical protein
MTTIDLQNELKTLTPEESFRLYAARLQIWRLCGKASCRRAQACRGNPRLCGLALADWAEEVKLAGQIERSARDPQAIALRAELLERVERLSRTVRDEK